jgi:taurine dioxygenase
MMTDEKLITFEPLSPELGARVHGVDLTRLINEDSARTLRAGLARHMVLCVSKQKISGDDHIRFAQVFGKADADFVGKPTRNETLGEDGPAKRGILFISNMKEDGKHIGALPDGELQFHSDGAHRKKPYRATTLYSLKIPSTGGDTKFANMAAAWEALPSSLRERLADLRVYNVYDTRAHLRSQTDENDDTLSNAVHQLVQTHPDTGRKSLFLSRLMTRRIVGWDRAASDALLDQLFDHIEKPEFVYSHKWQLDEIVIWDNRSVNHARSDFPPEEIRHMRRVTVSEP